MDLVATFPGVLTEAGERNATALQPYWRQPVIGDAGAIAMRDDCNATMEAD